MEIAVLSGVLALVVGGCVCVVWAARGGPRWVRVVARVTLFAGELARKSDSSRKSNDQTASTDSS
ncbi:hypothetical protein [Streptomyces sp. NPDC002156]